MISAWNEERLAVKEVESEKVSACFRLELLPEKRKISKCKDD